MALPAGDGLKLVSFFVLPKLDVYLGIGRQVLVEDHIAFELLLVFWIHKDARGVHVDQAQIDRSQFFHAKGVGRRIAQSRSVLPFVVLDVDHMRIRRYFRASSWGFASGAPLVCDPWASPLVKVFAPHPHRPALIASTPPRKARLVKAWTPWAFAILLFMFSSIALNFFMFSSIALNFFMFSSIALNS